MSEENVEIVRRAFAEFERGNFTALEFFDPDVRVEWLPVAGEKSETVGADGLRSLRDWMEPWEQVTIQAERFIDAGDRVVIIAEWQGRGKASGAATAWRFGSVWTLRDGRAISIDSYTDPDAALKAVGLAE